MTTISRMELILYFFFKLRLIFSLVFDFTWFVLKTLIGTTSFFLFIVFITFVVYAFFLRETTIQRHFEQERYQKIQVQRNQVWTNSQIQKWEKIATQIPSRVVYIYLAELYEFLGQDEMAQQSVMKAKDLDPNYFFGHFPASR